MHLHKNGSEPAVFKFIRKEASRPKPVITYGAMPTTQPPNLTCCLMQRGSFGGSCPGEGRMGMTPRQAQQRVGLGLLLLPRAWKKALYIILGGTRESCRKANMICVMMYYMYVCTTATTAVYCTLYMCVGKICRICLPEISGFGKRTIEIQQYYCNIFLLDAYTA